MGWQSRRREEERWLLFFFSSCRLIRMEAFDIGGYGGTKCFYKQDGASRQRLINTSILLIWPPETSFRLGCNWLTENKSFFRAIFSAVKHSILISLNNLKYSSHRIKNVHFSWPSNSTWRESISTIIIYHKQLHQQSYEEQIEHISTALKSIISTAGVQCQMSLQIQRALWSTWHTAD